MDSPRGIDLGDLIRRIQTAKEGQGRNLEIDLSDKVIAKGHEERVERVIGHVVQNALDATEKGGRAWVRLERQGAHASGQGRRYRTWNDARIFAGTLVQAFSNNETGRNGHRRLREFPVCA